MGLYGEREYRFREVRGHPAPVCDVEGLKRSGCSSILAMGQILRMNPAGLTFAYFRYAMRYYSCTSSQSGTGAPAAFKRTISFSHSWSCSPLVAAWAIS